MISFRPAIDIVSAYRDHGAPWTCYIPTAVNFPLMCRIMMTVMAKATMCIALVAIWKMMVLATSIFRA